MKEGELPGAARVEGEHERASMGRRGLRREMERFCERTNALRVLDVLRDWVKVYMPLWYCFTRHWWPE